MAKLTLGIIGHSHKESERRVPVHPAHFDLIPADLRARLVFEKGYGKPFGIPDSELAGRFGGLVSREELLRDCDIVLLFKPIVEDLENMRKRGVLWGCPHCVQHYDMTQVAIDRQQTLIAWEAMFTWKDGVRGHKLVFRNNEIAGYCGVVHAMGLEGIDGSYGPPLKAVVLSLGSVSRGAIHAMRGHGIEDITVYTQRAPISVFNRPLGCRFGQMVLDEAGNAMVAIEEDGTRRPLVEALAEADLIVNGILQNTDRPTMFIREGEENRLKPGSLIVDGSCDQGMGFPFARPTTFKEPTFKVGKATYYSVDHMPSYLWQSASWEISRVVLAFLDTLLGGSEAWEQDETIRRAIEIRDGVIQNKKILSFQNRSSKYPHSVIK